MHTHSGQAGPADLTRRSRLGDVVSRRLVFLLVVCIGTLSACRPDPGRQLADSTLVELMVDLRLLDAAASAGDTTRLAFKRDSVFAAHRIDTSLYRAELEARSANLSEYLDLYDAVLSRLNEIRLGDGAQPEDSGETPR